MPHMYSPTPYRHLCIAEVLTDTIMVQCPKPVQGMHEQIGQLTSIAVTTSWHMLPTMAATAELSAPPLNGSRKPLAPDRLR